MFWRAFWNRGVRPQLITLEGRPYVEITRFAEENQDCTVAFDAECRNAVLCPDGRVVSIGPISGGLQTFIAEQLNRDNANGT